MDNTASECARRAGRSVAISVALGAFLAIAGAASTVWSGAAQAQVAEAYRFDIAAQPLADALVAFGLQSGYQVTVDGAAIRGVSTNGVSGQFSAAEALTRLLSGTGLDYGLDGRVVTVSQLAPTRLGPIVVDAVLGGTLTQSYAAPDSFGATRTNTPIIETPQSTQAVTRQLLEDAGATEVADAYDYLAGIARENNFGGIFGDDYLARGFETDNLLFNGNRTGQPTTLDTANVERIEALRGPTATLFGRADPGGLINVVTKQPLAEPFYQADLTGGSGFFGDGSRFREGRLAIDAGGPIDTEGRLRYRFNLAAEHETTFRQDIDETLFFVSPVIDFEIDDRTVANLELTYQYREDVFDRGVFFIDDDLPLDRDFNLAEDQTEYFDKHYASAALRIDRQLAESVTGRLGLYASFSDAIGDGLQVDRVVGSTASVERREIEGSALFLTAQPELVAEFATGSVGHTLLFGLDASYQRPEDTSRIGAGGPFFDALNPSFPLEAPEIDISQRGAAILDRRFDQTSLGLYAQDQIDLTDQWKLLLGLRWDAVWLREEQELQLGTGGAPLVTERDEEFADTALLPRVGLVYQPIEQVSLFGSYAETYRPPTIFALTDAEGNEVEPEEGRSFEVGIKVDAFDGRVSGTLAAFRADKENVLEPDPDDRTGRAVINLGEVRSEGIEFDLAGEIFENLSLGVNYAFTDARISSNDNPSLPRDTRIRNVPRHAASLQAAYRFTEGTFEGLRLFGGVVYEDQKPSETSGDSPPELPDYVRFDLGASYAFTENVQARLQIRNLTDEVFYTSAGGRTAVTPGQPFNATLGVRVRF